MNLHQIDARRNVAIARAIAAAALLRESREVDDVASSRLVRSAEHNLSLALVELRGIPAGGSTARIEALSVN